MTKVENHFVQISSISLSSGFLVQVCFSFPINFSSIIHMKEIYMHTWVSIFTFIKSRHFLSLPGYIFKGLTSLLIQIMPWSVISFNYTTFSFCVCVSFCIQANSGSARCAHYTIYIQYSVFSYVPCAYEELALRHQNDNHRGHIRKLNKCM